MVPRSACLLALVLASALPAHAADCTQLGLATAWALVQGHLVGSPAAIADSQRHVNVISADADLAVDGIWGPRTERALCAMLELYGEVNGVAPDDLLRTPDEAPAFVAWLEAAARSVTDPPVPAAPD